MRIGIFADIHANNEALAATLAHANSHGVDQYVFLGDYIGYGADPVRVVETIADYCNHGGTALIGNHDDAVVKNSFAGMYDDAVEAIRWTRAQLSEKHLQFISSLPYTVEHSDIFYTHANVWDPCGWNYTISADDAKKSLDATMCRIIFCGHLHEQACYHQGITGRVVLFNPVAGVPIPLGSNRRWVAVVGAVGQPRDGNPSASYCIYDETESDLTYFRVPYDIDSACLKIRKAGLSEFFASRLEKGT